MRPRGSDVSTPSAPPLTRLSPVPDAATSTASVTTTVPPSRVSGRAMSAPTHPADGPGPRVLVVTPDFPPVHGGIQTLMGKLATLLPVPALEVVTLDAPGAGGFDDDHAVTVRRVRLGARARRLRMASLWGAALDRAARFGPDVVLLGHVAAAPAGAVIRQLLRIPVVTYTHAEEFRVWPRRSAFAMRHCDDVIAVSRHTERMARSAGAPADRVHRIPHGVDLPVAVGRTEPGAHAPTVLTVARMRDPHKGHDVMLRALPIVRRHVPDARWVVVGDGPLRPGYERLAGTLGLQDAVTFTGPLADDQRDAWMRRADVFAMPTRVPADGLGGEGFGIAYLEAAAHGLPVIAANAGGAVDAVDGGRTGLLVDPTDHRAVAGALIRLLGRPDEARAMGERALAWAAEFPWQRTADELTRVLRDTVARRERR